MTLAVLAKKDRLRESGTFAWIVVIALGLMSPRINRNVQYRCRFLCCSCM